MSLDRSVTINLGGKERKIKFNALGVSQLERMLDDHNVYKMVNGGVIALGDLAKCLIIALSKAGVFGFARKVLETENNTLEIEAPPDDEEVGK